MWMRVLAGAVCAGAVVAAADAQGPKPPDKAPIAELWVQPGSSRNLFHGVGGARLAPNPRHMFDVIEVKRGGFSDGYTVKDPHGREWSAKFPPEAHSEITSSRILWGVGYHQPPIYLLTRWDAEGGTTPNPQLPARFREKDPNLRGLAAEGEWSYYRNPFVGTPQLKGLLVLQAMLGNNDLKDAQNAVYTLQTPLEGARRWYVARDLGHTLGRPAVMGTREGDIEAFERQPFITGVREGRVQFGVDLGRHAELFEDIRPADVVWICERLDRLTDTQWRDAFRAGGYPPDDAGRFIRRFEQMIAEGLALKGDRVHAR
jgi:hypothetical protein